MALKYWNNLGHLQCADAALVKQTLGKFNLFLEEIIKSLNVMILKPNSNCFIERY